MRRNVFFALTGTPGTPRLSVPRSIAANLCRPRRPDGDAKSQHCTGNRIAKLCFFAAPFIGKGLVSAVPAAAALASPVKRGSANFMGYVGLLAHILLLYLRPASVTHPDRIGARAASAEPACAPGASAPSTTEGPPNLLAAARQRLLHRCPAAPAETAPAGPGAALPPRTGSPAHRRSRPPAPRGPGRPPHSQRPPGSSGSFPSVGFSRGEHHAKPGTTRFNERAAVVRCTFTLEARRISSQCTSFSPRAFSINFTRVALRLRRLTALSRRFRPRVSVEAFLYVVPFSALRRFWRAGASKPLLPRFEARAA